MGQGGYIVIANATPYAMQSTYNHSYQMNSWSFPQTINAGTCVSVYVEWDQSVFDNQSDDSGEQNYTFNGLTFQIQARAQNGFNLGVQLQNFGTQGVPQGTTLNLGWNHNGNVFFILSETNGILTSTNLSGAWMQNSLAALGSRTLLDLCIPGSHDAGMSQFNSHTAFAATCNTITQTNSIGGQLSLGSRYFDIRPVISAGQYYTGHYSLVSQINSWQGANGESIASIVNDVNAFTANNKELVILYLSHDLNTDAGNNNYPGFDQDEWNSLFAILKGINNLYVAPADANLTKLTLNQFIGNNKAAVVLIVDPTNSGIQLGSYAGNGFFPATALNLFNSYSNTNDLPTMTSDQLSKMKAERTPPNLSYFLLSWTLSQDNTEVTTCAIGTANSILDLANIANQALPGTLLQNVSSNCYPNIIYTDNVSGFNVAALAMAVNSIAIN